MLTEVACVVLAVPLVAGFIYGTACDIQRSRRFREDPPRMDRYMTTLELYATAAGALEPLGVIDQEMASRILAGADLGILPRRTASAVTLAGTK